MTAHHVANATGALPPSVATRLGVSEGAEGAIWSGGPNRGANAPAGAGSPRLRGETEGVSRLGAVATTPRPSTGSA
jgi:hypothetical protein